MRSGGLRLALLLLLGFLIAFGAMYKLMDSVIAESVIPSMATAKVNIKNKKPEGKEEAQPAAAPAPAPAQPEIPKEAPKEEPKEHLYSVLIKKGSFTAVLLDNGKPVREYRCAVGENPGQKEREGDRKTPTGTFTVKDIEDASGWPYDFKDGRGKVAGGYGPWYISLDTDELSGGKWSGIGIMGTPDDSLLGKRSTAGGVRLKNEDLNELKEYIKKGTKVTIEE